MQIRAGQYPVILFINGILWDSDYILNVVISRNASFNFVEWAVCVILMTGLLPLMNIYRYIYK